MLAAKYPAGRVLGIDLTEPMLEMARRRAQAKNVEFIRKDMTATGLPDETADIVAGSYAIRNAPELRQAFVEIHRILRPGGFVALLDFSKSPKPWFQRLQLLVLKYWCGLWGLILHGNPEVHSYIAASLKNFPDRIQLYNMLQECGFAVSYAKRFYLGTLELLVLQKPGR